MPLHDLAFYCACAFLVGIFLSSISSLLGIVLILVTLGLIFFWRRFGARVAIIILALFIFGYGYVFMFGALHKEKLVLDTPLEFSGIVLEPTLQKAKSQQISVSLLAPYRGDIIIYADSYPEFSYGDLLTVSGIIQQSSSGNFYFMSFPKVKLIKTGQGSQIKQFLFAFKDKFTNSFRPLLPAEESALLEGLLTGDTADFSPAFKEAIRQSGMSHIVALSGYNISIIGIALSFLLGYFLTPQKAFYFSVTAIILFVVMTGASASAVRAAVMGIILLIAKRTGRLYNFRNSIVITAALMALFDPQVLAYDIGFELSFGALIGIIYIMPILEKLFRVDTVGFLSWKANALATLSSQIIVLPLLLYYFQQFNLFSIIANILILEAIPLTMLLGFFLGLVGFFSGTLGALVALPVSFLLKYQIFVINFFSHAPIFSSVISAGMVFVYFGLLIWFIFAITYKKKVFNQTS